MGKQSRKLTALEVSRLKETGKHSVGEGLYLQISKTGSKSWLFRYSYNGKSKWMGLGPAHIVTLAEARSKMIILKKDLVSGEDPLLKKREKQKQSKLAEAKSITFDDCAKQYIEAHKPSWKNKKHISQWENTIKTYASPIIGGLPIAEIDLPLVLKVLRPIWYDKTETASRLRGRLERILSWAAVQGYRPSDNPAAWRGHLDQLLPKRAKVQKTQHFKAMPYDEVSSLIHQLRDMNGTSIRALEFLILTATRTSETLKATWNEINWNEHSWEIPAERMKAGKIHKVPLSSKAYEILLEMQKNSTCDYIFPGKIKGKPLSNMALLTVLRRLGHKVTTHGFRSSFSDWASEETNFSSQVIEMALAHTIKNKVEAAYRRGDQYFKRVKLMETWAQYCASLDTKKGMIFNLSNKENIIKSL